MAESSWRPVQGPGGRIEMLPVYEAELPRPTLRLPCASLEELGFKADMSVTGPAGQDFDIRVDVVDAQNGIIDLVVSEDGPPGEWWLIPNLQRLDGWTDFEYRARRDEVSRKLIEEG